MFFSSLWFNSKCIIAELNETEKIDLVGHCEFSCFLIMKFRIGKSLECFTALIFCDEAGTFKIIQCENILKLAVAVYNAAVSIKLSLFQSVDKEAFHVFWLLVTQHSSKIL